MVFRRCANFLLPAVGLRGAVDDKLNRRERIPYLGGVVNTARIDYLLLFLRKVYFFTCFR